MATKDRRKLQHIHSSIADKQPTPQSLEVGEIAVNNSANKEFLSLKNSNDKVVRFSTDSTIIDWIENKEVIPYKGYVRGETGPSATSGDTPTPDGHGSYGITNNDLLNNKSNIIVKINQVAAKKTVKYNKINAAKDLYNKDVNPSENTPTGKTDGAGFFIDMSRYAMIGANPSFSSITVTDKSDLSGNTTIANGDGTGTRTGHTLAIKTTDVTANDTNWTETITNKTSTVTNKTDKITTLKESATTRTTVVGTENLTVSGTTTEVHTGNVTVTNSANVSATTNGTTTETKVGNVVENHSGTTVENKKGVVTENNLSAKTENTAGVLTENNSSNHIVNTTGATNITRTGAVTEDNKNNVTRTTSGTTTETFKDQVTENNQSGYTVNTTGNVITNTTGTTTEVKVGDVTENHSGTTTENYAGKWTVNVTSGTEITSCSSTTINTNKFKVTQCDGDAGTAEFDFCDGYKINTDKMEILQCSENGIMDVKEKAITVSGTSLGLTGTNLTIRESGATNFSGNTLTATTARNANINVKGNLVEAVTGTTEETHSGAVTINNGEAKTENTTGVLTENNSSNHIVNTTGTTTIKSTGSTNIETNGANNKVTIQASGNGGDVEVFAKDTLCESGVTAAFNGTTKTNIGINCNDGGRAATTNVYGDTINHRANTADTRVTSAYTSATTATTVIGTANASATTAMLSGNTFDITEATRLSAKTPSAYVSGTSLSVVETNTDIESCGRISGKTNAFTIQECAAGNGKTVINQTDIKASGKTLSFDETTSISAKTPTTTLSGTNLNVTETTSTINSVNTNLTGTNLTISEDNTVISSCTKVEVNTNDLAFRQCEDGGAVNFEFCEGFNVKSDAVKFEQCGNDGSFTVNEKDTTISGTNLNVNETTTTVNSTNTIVSGTSLNVTETNTNMGSSEATCITAGTTAAFVGTTKTNIGKDCSDGGQTTTLNLNGDAINETGGTIVQTSTGDTTVNVGGDLVENVTGSTTENHTGPVTENNAGGLTIATTGKTCIQSTTDVNIGGNSSTNIGVSCDGTVYSDNVKIYAQTSITETADTVNISGTSNVNVNGNTVCVNATSKANFYGAETNIGVECGGSTATTVNISGATINEGGTTNNNDFTTINNNTTTYNITGDTNIEGDAYISGILTIPSGISKKLSWTAGSFTPDSVGYNGSEDKVITVPTAVSHLTRGNLTVTHNGLTDTFDPASDKSMTLPHSALTWSYGSVKGNTGSDSYDTSAEKSITIPTKVQHLDEWDGSCLVLPGCVQASGFYQSSDINLKENVASANFSKQVDANNIAIEQFNYKSDESKRTVYGVIAQDVEQLGLEELVYTNDEGFKSVDYTSLMLLKIAYLENENKRLNHKLDLLTERLDKIENKE